MQKTYSVSCTSNPEHEYPEYITVIGKSMKQVFDAFVAAGLEVNSITQGGGISPLPKPIDKRKG